MILSPATVLKFFPLCPLRPLRLNQTYEVIHHPLSLHLYNVRFMRPPKTSTRSRRAAPQQLTSPEELERLRDKIELFLVEHPRALLSEPGKELLDLSTGRFSLDTEYGKLIWHIWNDRTNLVRQITGLAKEKPGRLELLYQRFGKGPPGTLIVAGTHADSDALDRRGRRIEYLNHLRRWLGQLFPGAHVDDLTTEASLKDSLSGCYTRGLSRESGRNWAVIGVGPEESLAVIDGILTYGLIWLDLLRARHPNQVISGLKVFVPQSAAKATQRRMAWLSRQVALWELYETTTTPRLLDATDAGNLRTRIITPAASVQQTAPSESAGALLMKSIEALRGSTGSRVIRRAGADGLLRWSVNGLVFARQCDASPGAPIVFGLGRAETTLDQSTLPRLERLALQLLDNRCAQPAPLPGQRGDAAHAQHPLYRLLPEAWLESAILAAPEVIVPDIHPTTLAAQVFTVAGLDQGLADLIGVAQSGRLVVMELKANEDIHLPMQALDYWTVAHWHLERGSFAKGSFFGGRIPSTIPPKLLLVSPGLQFHPTCATILRYFDPRVEVEMVGLNEAWREQLQVVFRKSRSQM